MKNQEQKDIRILGVNDDVNICDCCGKKNLKKVVWLEIDGGDPVAYGTSCAARTIGLNGTYTASNAHKLVRDHNDREERRAKFQAAKEQAQEEANKQGEEIGVFRNRDGALYTYPLEAAFQGHMRGMRGFPKFTAKPETK